MAQISYIDTGPKQTPDLTFNIPTDESVGAMLFDISGFDRPFDGYPQLYHNFKDSTALCVKNMDDAMLLGIEDNGFMNGLLYYHLSKFYEFIGGNQALYVVIADCSYNWNAIQSIQQQAGGRVFQIGVWTAQPIWRLKDDGSYGFTSLATDLQAQADEINGKVGASSHATVPLNIILCGNCNHIEGEDLVNWKNLPDATVLNCPKVSAILAQDGSAEVHAIQGSNPNHAPVSSLGFAMACLAVCGAEESIASVKKCDLNKDEGFCSPELGIGADGTPIDAVNRVWANILSSKGYIIPIGYDGLEGSCFFSSDQTLCEGDYGSIANSRVMHKCRRAVSTALIPYINSSHIYSSGTKNISSTSIAVITQSVNTILDSVMRNKNGQRQIDSRSFTFMENDNMLNDDSVSVRLDIKPVNYNGVISEEISHDTV